MRITTYKKGGNSLNPLVKILLFLVILSLFVMPVSAFTDDFEDKDILDWNVISGVWVAGNGTGIEGINDYYLFNNQVSGATSEIEIQTTGVIDKYIEFNFKTSGSANLGGASTATTHIYLFDDGVTSHGFTISATSTTQDIDVIGWSYNPYSLSADTWYKIAVTRTITNIKVDIYDISGALLDTQTSAYTWLPNADKISIDSTAFIGGSISIYIDNIFTSNVAPETINSIGWGEDQYIEGDTASYTWVLQNSAWQNLIYKYRVQVLYDGVEIESNKVSQTGTRYVDVDTAGTYTANLQYSGLIFTNWVGIDTDTVHVIPEVDSVINVPDKSAIKTNFTATYIYGSSVNLPIINIKELQNDFTYKIIDTKILPEVIAGTTYTTNLSISKIGNFVADLYDNGQGKSFATDAIQTNFVYIPPSDVVITSYINTTENIYSLGGIISGDYAIDDSNYTDYHTKLEVYNVDKDVVSFSFIPLHQIDSFDISVSEYDIYTDGANSYPVNTNFLAGQNAVRLASYNTDGALNSIITQKNITLSVTDSEGYGLTLSKYIVEENEIFAIKAISPVQADIVIHPLSILGVSDYTIKINGSSQITHAIGLKDTYLISLVSGGEVKATQIIKVLEGTEIITPPDGEIIPDTTLQDNTNTLLNSPYLIGLFIMAVFLAIGATRGIGGMIVTGSMGLGIVCYMGIFPWVLLVIEVLVVAALFSKGLIDLSGD